MWAKLRPVRHCPIGLQRTRTTGRSGSVHGQVTSICLTTPQTSMSTNFARTWVMTMIFFLRLRMRPQQLLVVTIQSCTPWLRNWRSSAAEAKARRCWSQDVRDKRKVLIFSYFADTVDWIAAHLTEVVERDARLRASKVASPPFQAHSGPRKKCFGVSLRSTTDAPDGADDDLYDIVITTDVLSEGVNLQQARHIINFDLPWNPMRLVQRHGRIDRIGSPHRTVYLRCVFPDAQLDELARP